MIEMGIAFWVVLIVTVLFGFYMAWTIGANDVANSMGTVFGSGSLSLKRVIAIAVIFEFLGAFLVGSHVTKTLKSGIVDPNYFTDQSYFSGNEGLYLFIAGMLAVLLAASLWVTLATYRSLPISTSQSIVGAVAGFGLVSVMMGYIPLEAINGYTLITISLGWILSPIFGGILSFFLFMSIRKTIFDSQDPIARARKVISLFIFFVFFILIMACLSGNLKNLRGVLENYISSGVCDQLFDNLAFKLALSAYFALVASMIGSFWLRRSKRLLKWKPYDAVEKMFGMLLILTACYVAFAHGANDVANAIAPVAAIYQILSTGNITATVGIPTIILVLGGAGIVIGVATWGYKVMETVGKRITSITPSRGFAASFGAASSVLLCSMLGIPVSTSQIIVGSVIGVGLAGGIAAIDLRVVRKIVVSWVFTIPVAAVTTAVLFMVFRAIMINLV